MLKAGIVGLPNVGKSTLFNALTKNAALSANYIFTTIEPNKGIVLIEDERLLTIGKLTSAKKITPTTVEFVDIPGLVKGASLGEGLGNQFLDAIRNVDAICHVLRCFDDENITHINGKVDPISDLITVELEFILADLAVIERRINRLEKKVAVNKNSEEILELETILMLKKGLENEKPIRNFDLSLQQLKAIKNYNFLTLKPILIIANIAEDDLSALNNNNYYNQLLEYSLTLDTEVIPLCIKLEEDLNAFSDEERELLYEEMNIQESSLNVLIKASYNLLKLKTFFSFVSFETRAWTFKDGMNAKECAGIIHSDFEKGFIKAETLTYTELVECGSYQKCKERGKVRLEGKDYLVCDGDILLFKFNV